MAKYALIFGAGGFVGRYLAAELVDHGYEVVGTDRLGQCANPHLSGYRMCDITDAEGVKSLVADVKPSAIINLAAISSVGASWKMPQATMSVNVNGALNVLEAARAQAEKPKVLFIGSSEEYEPSEAPLSEADPVNANNPYGISKVAQEQFAATYATRYGVPVYWTRSFNHTGPGQTPTFVLPSWCKQVADIERSGKPGVMRVGNLQVQRDFSDVRDIVRGYRLLLESDHVGEPFNFGSGTAYELEELLYFITSMSTQEIKVEVDPALLRPADNPIICSDCAKAAKLLNWQPEYTVKDALKALYESYLRM